MNQILCLHCKQPIFDRHAISGARVEHWATDDNDFGCDSNPINTDDGVGNHEADLETYFKNKKGDN